MHPARIVHEASSSSAQPRRSQPIDIVGKRDAPPPPPLVPRGSERYAFAHRSSSRSASSSDDCPSPTKRKATQTFIRPFSGEDTNRCIEDFVADLDHERKRLGWNEATTLDQAKSLLTGQAASVFLTGDFISWQSGLREALVQRFGHRNALRHCTRLKGECVAEFRRRIAETAERESIRVFVRGLRPDIAALVMEATPRTLVDAACVAGIYESGNGDTQVNGVGVAFVNVKENQPDFENIPRKSSKAASENISH